MARFYKYLSFIPILFLFLALYFMHRQLQGVNFHDFYHQLRSWNIPRIGEALLCLGLSFMTLSAYDYVALWGLGLRVPLIRVIVTACSAFSVSNIVGHSLLSGSSIRFMSYSKSGADIGQVAQVALRNSINFWLGYGCLLGIGLLSGSSALSLLPEAYQPWLKTAAWFLLVGLVVFIGFSFALKGREWKIKKFVFRFPRGIEAILGAVLGSLDLILCSLTLYFVLPAGSAIPYFNFLVLYLVAQVIGIVSQVPGGLGVTDGLLLNFLGQSAPVEKLLVSILLFRLIYYALPLLLVLLVNLGISVWTDRERFSRTALASKSFVQPIVAPILAVLTAFCGAVLIVSGIFPSVHSRVESLSRWIFLPVIELSHVAGSLVGFALILLSHKIWRKNASAYRILLWLIAAGALASLLKGFDWEEATILILFGCMILPFRQAFYRKAPLVTNFGIRFDLSIALTLLMAIILGLFVYRAVPYSSDLWFTFEERANAARFLRSTAAMWALFFGFIVVDATRKKPVPLPEPLDTESLRAILNEVEDTTASLALLGDKFIRFSQDKRAFLMFAQQSRSWIVLGDIYGEARASQELLADFLDEADEADARVVFYECREAFVPRLLEAGMQVLKFGEEALIPLESFGLEGNARKSLRASYNRGTKDGLTFRIASRDELGALLPELRRVSNLWLQTKNVKEKGFSLGFFEERYLENFPCGLIEHEGRVVAFANILTGNGRELSIDLMRYDPELAPKATMDFLFVSILLWGKAEGFASFNMGMAPLSGIQKRPGAPLWYGFAQATFDKGEYFYNFKGLREYKEKYNPNWRSRYIAFDSGALMIQTMLDLALLIGGGVSSILSKKARP